MSYDGASQRSTWMEEDAAIAHEMAGIMNDIKLAAETHPVTQATREQREGPVARTIEQHTAELPSDIFLWGAVGAIGLALLFELTDRKQEANFVGNWVPTILTLGVYNKLVKLHGSDGR